ncbi:MAG: LytR C-terminal domain-containing protein, partial [Patescibacteria group bacterium]|nr:LytR C-terminal domain-containing protein [Patescibacteria group bacterium]
EAVESTEQKSKVGSEAPIQKPVQEQQKAAQMNQDINVGTAATVQQAQKQQAQIQKQQDQNMPQNEAVSQQSQNTDMTQAPKKKIMYAAPEKTLAKPASEPTTRAIDIEWMKDDEDVYSEEMQTQKKKLNVRFIVITIAIIVIVGLGSWWIITWFLNTQQEESVSVDTLIQQQEQNVNADESESENVTGEGADEDTKQDGTGENNGDEVDESGSVTIKPEDTMIQVLNAGAQSGVAGTVTNDFGEKDYQTKSAQNAQNNHEGVVIYYAPDKKDGLDAVSDLVSEEYGTQTHEESGDVTEKYGADFVIVLGS